MSDYLKFQLKNYWYEWYLVFFIFLMLVIPKMIPIGFMLYLPVVLFGLIKKELKFRFSLIGLLWISLYVCYAVYAVFTRHPDQAHLYLENKLSFVLLPVLLSFQPAKRNLNLKVLFSGFIFAVLLLILLSILHAAKLYVQGKGMNSWLTSEFSYIHHPTYFSVYISLAMVMAVTGCRRGWKNFQLKWLIPFLTVSQLSLMLCMSLAGLLFQLVLIAVFVLELIWRKWNKKLFWLLVVLMPIIFWFSVNYVPFLSSEWKSAVSIAAEYRKDPEAFIRNKQYPMPGSDVRLVMWTAASQLLEKYPMGVGTGNYDEVMTNHLNQLGQKELAKQQLNPHNQYLQIGIETGWIGLSLLLCLLIAAIIISFQQKNWILLILVADLAFNMLFESMLQRQSGIVFYPFFMLILVQNQIVNTRFNRK